MANDWNASQWPGPEMVECADHVAEQCPVKQAHEIVRQAFVQVGDREVHYRVVGMGPPALFVHSSPTNGSFVVPDMLAQCHRHTCIAFDTPGFGLSDALALEEMVVADLADALAEAMRCLGLPPVPVFGTHSGAAIALELGRRHPDMVRALVLDGVPIFTQEEVAPLRAAYFQPLGVDAGGGHFAATWTRFRDQYIWFPWCFRSPANLNEYDLGSPAQVHNWCAMFFAAARHYRPAYLAVTSYCEQAIAAAEQLAVPAAFTATPTDMLYPHLRRLPPLKAGQDIVEIGTAASEKHALVTAMFDRYGGDTPWQMPELRLARTDRICRQFVQDQGRAQFLRYMGDPANPPLLLLHDVPGSSQRLTQRMSDLARDHFVVAPDLPGSGESHPLDEQADLHHYALALWRLCDALGLARVKVEGHGLAASLAVEMAAAAPERCNGLALDGLLLPDAPARASLIAHYAPPIVIEPDGAHWYRLWLRLRDSLVYWPWYDHRRVALRRVEEDFDAQSLHTWTVEVMKQHASAHFLVQAILRHDAAARLAQVSATIESLPGPLSPVGQAFARQWAAIREAGGQAVNPAQVVALS